MLFVTSELKMLSTEKKIRTPINPASKQRQALDFGPARIALTHFPAVSPPHNPALRLRP